MLTSNNRNETESIVEKGDFKDNKVTSRTRERVAQSTESLSEALGPFSYNRVQSNTVTDKTQAGTIDLRSGEFEITFGTTVNNTILNYTEANQTMTAVISGSTNVETNTQKSGNNESGEFELSIETIVDMNERRVESNQTQVIDRSNVNITRKTLSETGNVKQGNYDIFNGFSEVLFGLTNSTETNQNRTIISTNTVLADTKSFTESGDLYSGEYNAQEQEDGI